MKNLFKNLMLVAVAAMAFTACQNDNNEVNEVNRVTRYEFTANIADDTRSGFAEKEEGATAYKSEWHEGDEVKLFITDNNGYYVETTAPINAKGQFTLELTDAPESFFMTVNSPAESWSGEYSSTIPAEQTPLANSVDPKAHLLQHAALPVSNGVAEINLTHQAAYGKMTVKGVDFAIDHVVVDLKGSFYGYDRNLSYTINADNVDNNTFWFATEPIDVAEFTVTAYDAEGNSVTKTVDVVEAGKTMSFAYGRVGTFSVKDLEVPTVPEEKFDSTYAYVYQDYGSTDKEIMFVAEDGRGLRIDFYDVYNNNCLVSGTYSFVGSNRMYPNWCYYYANIEDSYTTKLNDGQAVVSVEDGQYKIVFTNMSYNGTVYAESFTFKGAIVGLNTPDSRTQLETPTATATADGNVITISWNEVTGADEYYVSCTTGGLDAITTTETSVTIGAEYSTKYEFSIKAVASDSNPDYRTSEVYNFSVTTGKDPNKLADYELDYVTVSSSYFEFNRDWNNGSANTKTSLRIYLNSSDKGSNYINPGHYNCLGQGASTPSSAGSVNLRYCTDTWAYFYSTANSSSYLDVEIVDGQYVIIATIDGKTWGYKGLPTGWIIPEGGDSGEGGDEPVDPTPDPTPDPEPEPEPEPDPDPDQPVEDFTNWVFDAHYNTSNRVVTLSGRNDERVITLVTDELAFSKFYADSENYGDYFTNLTVDGVPTDDVTPTSYVQLKSSGVVINLVIKGVTYTGTSKSFSY